MKHSYFAGNGFVPVEYEDGGWDRNNRGYARGRGRGRGRSFRGRGRGGYNGPYVDGKQDGNFNNEAPAQRSGMFLFSTFCSFRSCSNLKWV